MRARLTVIIVAWNHPELLARCLDAVLRHLPEAQVIVVDNASQPPLHVPPGVTLLRAPANLGFAGGNNLALPHAEGEHLLLLNTDVTLPAAEPIRILQAALDAYPHLAALQPTLILPDGTLDTCGEYLTPLGILWHQGYRRPPGPHAQRPHPVLACKGACLLLRRAAIETAGGLFRPTYFCYGEDIDLCHRLWLAGWECWYAPTPPIPHAEAATARAHPPRRVWRRYLSNLLTTACALWGPRLWLTRGLPFLLCVALCALRHGVLPRPRRDPLPFRRRRTERDLLPRVTIRPTWRHYLTLATRRFADAPPPPPAP